jgi:hypothetical protein
MITVKKKERTEVDYEVTIPSDPTSNLYYTSHLSEKQATALYEKLGAELRKGINQPCGKHECRICPYWKHLSLRDTVYGCLVRGGCPWK